MNHCGQLEIKTLISTGVVAAHAIAIKEGEVLTSEKMPIQINVVIESN